MNRALPLFLFALGLLAGSSCRRASAPPGAILPDFSVQATLSTNTIRIGDLAELVLVAAHPAGSHVELPRLDRGNELVVRDHPLWQTRSAATNRQITRAVWRITSLALGEHPLSTGQVVFVLGDGTRRAEPFPLLTLRVESVLTNDAGQLRGIKGPVAWPAAVPRWIIALLAVALIALILGVVTSRALRRPRTFLRYPPPEPPDVIALRALRRLKEQGLIEKGLVEPFYVEVTSIVRRYLEARFGLRAPERTTEEFIREAAGSGLLTTDHQALVRNFLEQSDLVKFARFIPGFAEMKAAYQAAEKLVWETRPELPAPQSAP